MRERFDILFDGFETLLNVAIYPTQYELGSKSRINNKKYSFFIPGLNYI